MPTKNRASPEDIAEENRKLKRLRFMVDFTISLMYQSNMPVEEASEHVEKVRKYALRLFPGKETAFELIYAPRFRRVLLEIYGLH